MQTRELVDVSFHCLYLLVESFDLGGLECKWSWILIFGIPTYNLEDCKAEEVALGRMDSHKETTETQVTCSLQICHWYAL